MSATARSSPPDLRLEAPVPIRVEEQPVLQVVARDQPRNADAAIGDQLPDVLVERVEAEVEVDGSDDARCPGLASEDRRLRRGRRQGLLADHVASRLEDLAHLRVVQGVGGGDVHDVDGRICEQLIERAVGAGDAQLAGALQPLVRRPIQQSAHGDVQAPQCLDVCGTDEAAADDGRPDVLVRSHGLRSAGPPCLNVLESRIVATAAALRRAGVLRSPRRLHPARPSRPRFTPGSSGRKGSSWSSWLAISEGGMKWPTRWSSLPAMVARGAVRWTNQMDGCPARRAAR